MDGRTIGLIAAAGIGALASLLGSFLSNWLTAQRDREQWVRQQQVEQQEWLRNKREEAYKNSIRFLLRAMNSRSAVKGTAKEHMVDPEFEKEWFEELIEAQVSLATIKAYCSEICKDDINEALMLLETFIRDSVTYRFTGGIKRAILELYMVYEIVAECAEKDLKESFSTKL